MTPLFDDELIEILLVTRDEQKTIAEVKYIYSSLLKDDFPRLNELDGVHNGIKEYYSEISDGVEMYWKKDKNSTAQIGGYIKLGKMKHLFAGPKGNGIYYDEDDMSSDLPYFHPFDFPSPESYVGFVIKPDTIYKSVYYMSESDQALRNLDLDFQGYTQMALEARVFHNWQVVLLQHMSSQGEGKPETETFKTEMPKIFPDWTWENFIEKFENFRLSKQ